MMRAEASVRQVGIALILPAALLWLAGCEKQTPQAVAVAPAPAAVTATAPAAPKAEADPAYLASGPLVVEQQVDVASQRAGVVAKIAVDVGDHVRRGQLLAELDNRQLQADRDAAEAKVRSTEFEHQHWLAETKVRESDLARDEEMFKAQLITAKQLEHSRYASEGARYETDRERQNLRQAQQTLRSLELELEKTRLTAPFDGVVARRYVRAGQRLAANERAFWVTALAPVLVKFTVPQEFAGKLRRGGEVTVSSPAAPELRQPARITLVSPVVDPSSGTLEVEAQLARGRPDLVPGMTVSIRVPNPKSR